MTSFPSTGIVVLGTPVPLPHELHGCRSGHWRFLGAATAHIGNPFPSIGAVTDELRERRRIPRPSRFAETRIETTSRIIRVTCHPMSRVQPSVSRETPEGQSGIFPRDFDANARLARLLRCPTSKPDDIRPPPAKDQVRPASWKITTKSGSGVHMIQARIRHSMPNSAVVDSQKSSAVRFRLSRYAMHVASIGMHGGRCFT